MNELPAPTTIESGKIWENRSTKEILYGIAKIKKADYAILRIASHDINIDGEILLSKGSTVSGARLILEDGPVEGYPALKALLSVHDGTYSLLDYSQISDQAVHLEQGLKVKINQLLNALPNLPDTVEELTEGAVVGKIRKSDPIDLSEPQAETVKGGKVGPKTEPPHIETADEALKRTLPVAVIITAVILVMAIIATIAVIAFKPQVVPN